MKLCAFIRQSWYDAARQHLTDEQRLQFYETCFEYEFAGVEPPEDLPQPVALLFSIARDVLSEDREKVKARTERNRLNGQKGGRPANSTDNKTQQETTKPNGLNENPHGYFGLANTNTIYTTQHNTTKDNSFCTEEDREVFLKILVFFFSIGVADPGEETSLFWNYYSARGWMDKSGAAIVDRLALARSWRPKTCSAIASKRRVSWCNFLQISTALDDTMVTDFVSLDPNPNQKAVVLALKDARTAKFIEENCIDSLREWFKSSGWDGYSLQYKIIAPEIDMQ